jgi:hypothetical protein
MKRLSQFFLTFFSLAAIAISVVVVVERQAIQDWLVLRNYTPPEDIMALAERTSMTAEGKKLFYVHKPQLMDKIAFNEKCKVQEASIVLGCYDGIGIYVYDIKDERLAGVEEVTSAHEMLHAAYERLGAEEKAQLNNELQKALSGISNQRIIDLVASYRLRDPGSVPNELHSIFGTEIRNLSPKLEAHYKKYFLDRQRVVAYSEKYEQVFVGIKNQVEELDASLLLRKAEIERRENSLAAEEQRMTSWRARLDTLSRTDTAAYNAQVSSYNAAVTSYNQELQEVRALIGEYNRLVEERNALALQQNDLIKNLDSKAKDL